MKIKEHMLLKHGSFKTVRKLIPVALGIVIGISLCACEKKVTTVADDILSTGDGGEYITAEEFSPKGPAPEKRDDIDYCALLIPSDFHKSETTSGMYVNDSYPTESANIYYSVMDASDIGAISDTLTASQYKEAIEPALREAQGDKDIELVIDSFDKEEYEGIPCYKIRSHYGVDERRDLQQLCYIMMGSKTHVITYTQISDDEMMMDYMTSEGEIKLVRTTKP